MTNLHSLSKQGKLSITAWKWLDVKKCAVWFFHTNAFLGTEFKYFERLFGTEFKDYTPHWIHGFSRTFKHYIQALLWSTGFDDFQGLLNTVGSYKELSTEFSNVQVLFFKRHCLNWSFLGKWNTIKLSHVREVFVFSLDFFHAVGIHFERKKVTQLLTLQRCF